jgi:hypothetical protein
MDTTDLDEARQQLMKREGCLRLDDIGGWSATSGTVPPTIYNLQKWAESKGVDAVVWTALPAKHKGKAGRPTANQILTHLKGLTGAQRDEAERYIRRAPRQVDTPYRRIIESELGWIPTAQAN